MSDACYGARTVHSHPSKPTVAGALTLAASPTFALMALLGPADAMCTTSTSPLSGMAMMYLLMSAFHATPWLRLFRGQRDV